MKVIIGISTLTRMMNKIIFSILNHIIDIYSWTRRRSVIQPIVIIAQHFCYAIEKRARKIALNILKVGPIPKHVAFVMDGNRRYAKGRKKTPGEGHREGFGRLQETLDWCLQLGISTVTVYAFSVDNFRRSQEEVNTLMALALEKFEEFATQSHLIMKHGIRVRVIGETQMLPPHIHEAANRVMEMTRNHSNTTLNICFPYTSRHEITSAVRRLVEAAEDGRIQPSDITAEMIERCLGTCDDEELDLLVRTSGEIRLSDFLLWQSSTSCHIHFASKYWPEFTFWDMFLPILAYQVRYEDIMETRRRRRQELNYVLPSGPLSNICQQSSSSSTVLIRNDIALAAERDYSVQSSSTNNHAITTHTTLDHHSNRLRDVTHAVKVLIEVGGDIDREIILQ